LGHRDIPAGLFLSGQAEVWKTVFYLATGLAIILRRISDSESISGIIRTTNAEVAGSSLISGKTCVNIASVNPGCHRRNTMKSSTKDQAKGNFHKVKGTIKEIAGKVSMDPDLEGEGKDEKKVGKIRQKIGEIEKVVGK
jgi:uncharacterized protein YjbJ (UPF0337 family)